MSACVICNWAWPIRSLNGYEHAAVVGPFRIWIKAGPIYYTHTAEGTLANVRGWHWSLTATMPDRSNPTIAEGNAPAGQHLDERHFKHLLCDQIARFANPFTAAAASLPEGAVCRPAQTGSQP